MSIQNHSCSNVHEIIDCRSGDYICTQCGLVLDKFYEIDEKPENTMKYYPFQEYVYEVLEKLNLPSHIASYVRCGINDGANKQKIL